MQRHFLYRRPVLVAVLALGTASAHATQFTFDSDPTLSPTQAPGAWYTDRFAPAEFRSATFDGDARLLHGLSGADEQDSSFRNYQGRKYDTGLSGPSQTFSIDLFVGEDWAAREVNAGMWGTGIDGAGDISAYPILAFRNGADIAAGFYAFDYFGGDWILETPVGEVGEWYTLSFDLSVGTGVEYFVDGSSIGTFADTGTTSLDNVILNAYNFGEDIDVYWDNFSATGVPEPGTWCLLGASVAGVGAMRRRARPDA